MAVAKGFVMIIFIVLFVQLAASCGEELTPYEECLEDNGLPRSGAIFDSQVDYAEAICDTLARGGQLGPNPHST